MSFDDNSNDYSFNSDYSADLNNDYSAKRDNVPVEPSTPPKPKRGRWIESIPLIFFCFAVLSLMATFVFIVIDQRSKKMKAETAKVTATAFAREIASFDSSGEVVAPRPVPPSLKKTAVIITNGDTKVHALEILHTGKDRIAVEVVTNEGE